MQNLNVARWNMTQQTAEGQKLHTWLKKSSSTKKTFVFLQERQDIATQNVDNKLAKIVFYMTNSIFVKLLN